MTDTLLDRLGVAQVIFLNTIGQKIELITPVSSFSYHEDNSSKITSQLEVTFGHFLSIWNDHGASLAGCGVVSHVLSQISSIQQTYQVC